MATKVKFDPSKIGFTWSTGSNYRIALTSGFVKGADDEQQPNPAIPTATNITTYSQPLLVVDVFPDYDTTASLTATVSITYDRIPKNFGANKNYYLYEKDFSTSTFVSTISNTSTLVATTGRSVLLNVANLIQPTKLYYITADEGVVSDIYNFNSNAIVNDSTLRWYAGTGAFITGTTFTNYAESGNNGLVKFVNLYANENLSTGTGNIVIYTSTGTVYKSWAVGNTDGVDFFGNNRVRIQTNENVDNIAPEGTYYILFNQDVLQGTSTGVIAITNPNSVRWTNTVIKDIGNYTFSTATNYIFTGTNPNILFNEGVAEGAPQERLLTLTLSGVDGQFGHATTGTTSGTSWTVQGTSTYLNTLWNDIYYQPNVNFSSSFTYTLSYSSGTLASNSKSLTYVPLGFQFPAPLLLTVASDGYRGSGAPYVKDEAITLTASITTSSVITDHVIFRINNENVAQVNMSHNGSANIATTTTIFATTGTKIIQAIWDGAIVETVNYNPLVDTATITILPGYTLEAPFTVTASTPRTIDENIVFTATFTTSTVVLNTVTFFANTLTLGNVSVNTITNTAILTATIANSGTYTISAIWNGGNIDDNRYYVPLTSTSSIFVDAAQQIDSITLDLNTSTFFVDKTTIWSERPKVFATATLSAANTLSGIVTFVVDKKSVNTTGVGNVVTFTPAGFSSNSFTYLSDPTITVENVDPLTVGYVFTIQTSNYAQRNDFTIIAINTATKTITVRETIIPQSIPWGGATSYQDPFMTALGYPSSVGAGRQYAASTATVSQRNYAAQFIELLKFWVSPNPFESLEIPTPIPDTFEYVTATIVNNVATATIELANLAYSGTSLTTSMFITARFDGQSIVPKYYPKLSTTSTVLNVGKFTPTVSMTTGTFYQYNTNTTVNTSVSHIVTLSGDPTYQPTGVVELRSYDGSILYTSTTLVSTTGTISFNPWNLGLYYTTELRVKYLGNNANNSAFTNVIVRYDERRPSNLSFSQSTATMSRGTVFTFVVSTTEPGLNGQNIRWVDNNVVIGNSVITNNTATFVYNSTGKTLGSHQLVASTVPQPWAYNFVSAIANFTIT